MNWAAAGPKQSARRIRKRSSLIASTIMCATNKEIDQEDRRRLSPAAKNPSSVATATLCRQASEVGAACGNSARADLCGGAAGNDRLLYVASGSAVDYAP